MEDNIENNEIYSEKVRAGRRTYFFDIKATRSKDYFLSITESKRTFKDGEDSNEFTYVKRKLFLYKEDVNKFINALNKTTDHLKNELLPNYDFDTYDNNEDLER